MEEAKKASLRKTANLTTSEEGDSKDKCGLADSAGPSTLTIAVLDP